MKPDQKCIYFIPGEGRAQCEMSPALETVRVAECNAHTVKLQCNACARGGGGGGRGGGRNGAGERHADARARVWGWSAVRGETW